MIQRTHLNYKFGNLLCSSLDKVVPLLLLLLFFKAHIWRKFSKVCYECPNFYYYKFLWYFMKVARVIFKLKKRVWNLILLLPNIFFFFFFPLSRSLWAVAFSSSGERETSWHPRARSSQGICIVFIYNTIAAS